MRHIRSPIHSYEEIRSVALDILSGRERLQLPARNYENLRLGIGEVFARREHLIEPGNFGATYPPSDQDNETFLEVFWDLFRQGIITLGSDDANRQFPHFRVTQIGKNIIENLSTYFFHDASSYEKIILSEIPHINTVTLIYLKEAMQAFYSGCILSSTVMIGVATEHTFLLLVETIERNQTYQNTFSSVFNERTILQKFNKFRNILEQNIKILPPEIKEDIDTHFAGILSVIRTFRNQSGHPSGKILDREQNFVLLQLFIPYCKKLYQLMEFFS